MMVLTASTTPAHINKAAAVGLRLACMPLRNRGAQAARERCERLAEPREPRRLSLPSRFDAMRFTDQQGSAEDRKSSTTRLESVRALSDGVHRTNEVRGTDAPEEQTREQKRDRQHVRKGSVASARNVADRAAVHGGRGRDLDVHRLATLRLRPEWLQSDLVGSGRQVHDAGSLTNRHEREVRFRMNLGRRRRFESRSVGSHSSRAARRAHAP